MYIGDGCGDVTEEHCPQEKKYVKVVSLYLLQKFSVRSFKTDLFLLQTSEGDVLI